MYRFFTVPYDASQNQTAYRFVIPMPWPQIYIRALWGVATIPAYLEFTEKIHLQSTPLEHSCTQPNVAATVGNIFGNLLWNIFQCHRHWFFFFLGGFNIRKCSSLSGRPHFWKQPEIISSQIRGAGWVFYFSNRFMGQKFFDRKRLVGWSIAVVDNSKADPKFRPFSTHSFT